MLYSDTDEYLVSHNVFDNNDGSTVTVDITSAFYENGVITLRATDCKEDMKIYEDAVSVTIRKYNTAFGANAENSPHNSIPKRITAVLYIRQSMSRVLKTVFISLK